MKGNTILAATFGWGKSEISEYRYKNTRTPIPIYVFGDEFFAVNQNKPNYDVGAPWEKYNDQFWAYKNNTIIWVARVNSEKKLDKTGNLAQSNRGVTNGNKKVY